LLHAYREAGQVVFEVEDNGIGISPRDQKRIFRRFYQVDQRLARATGGCGLGLSIVEFIARAHGGAVRVKSQPGAGSTFRVSLPCDSGAAV
jgi:signal transduction histidine kinase